MVNLATLPRPVPGPSNREIKGNQPSSFRESCMTYLSKSCTFLFFLTMASGIIYGIAVSIASMTRKSSPSSSNDSNGTSQPPTSSPTDVPPLPIDPVSSGPIDPTVLDKTVIPLFWFDLTCGAASPPSTPVGSVQKAVEFNNDILTRSKAGLRMSLVSVRNVTAPASCFILGNDLTTVNKITQSVNLMISEAETVNYRHALRVVRVITGQEAVSGFTITGSGTSFVRPNEYSRVVAHELGHAMGLMHAFPNTTGVLDLPPACTANEAARIALLARCPVGVRTCKGALVDEDINNIMDYLPESCGRSYTLTSGQIGAMHQWVNSKYM
jgi:hypothetical protein